MDYKVLKKIATIKDGKTVQIQLNQVKWGSNPVKYDIRKWEGDKPQKGISLNDEEAESLLLELGKELGYKCEKMNDKSHGEMKVLEKNVSMEIDYRNFVVHSNTYDCKKLGHDCEEITAVVPLYSDGYVKTIEFPARFCRTCKAYYISEYTYMQIKKQGHLLCQVASMAEYEKYKKEKTFGELSLESIIHIIGYNVDAKNNLSEKQRRTILIYAIEEGIEKKEKIINHLSYLIKLNEKNPGKSNAIEKWSADRDYLRGYKTGSQKLVGVSKILIGNEDMNEPLPFSK